MREDNHAIDRTARIRRMIEDWAAVRKKDMATILRDHDADFVMFDLPPPLVLRGIAA
jgi:ketosteroid isomerase-like protein